MRGVTLLGIVVGMLLLWVLQKFVFRSRAGA
jgi:hypothetical protein